MPEIGGYFGLETCLGGNGPWHDTLCLNSVRGALLWLLPLLRPAHAWLPAYSCEVLYHPFHRQNIPYTLYNLNESLEPIGLPEPSPGHLLVYINYNDVCRTTATRLAHQWKEQCIIDNTQAFFWQQPSLPAWSMNSARKWMGVPDGAYVYPPMGMPLPDYANLLPNENYTTRHLHLRSEGKTSEGYPYFLENERLSGATSALVSEFSNAIFQQADYRSMRALRFKNYLHLHDGLSSINLLQIQTDSNVVPMYYPLLPIKPIPHEELWNHKLYVPRYWSEVLNLPQANSHLKTLSSKLLPLPVDHRLNDIEIETILEIIASFIKI